MNIAKHMEVIFVAALAIIGATSFANASSVPAPVAAVAAAADSSAPMQVVTISAKRMTAAEKAAAQ
jgi:hypothetical protein